MDDLEKYRAKVVDYARQNGVVLSAEDVERIFAAFRKLTAQRHSMFRAMGGVLGADGKWRFYQRHDL